MSFSNVKLILSREIRDQLRDRRTLFMMFVLPLLLYPLLGMIYLKFLQFPQKKATTVLVIGAQDLVDLPPLFDNNRFARELFSDPGEVSLLELHFAPDGPPGAVGLAEARAAIEEGEYDAALYFPDGFADWFRNGRRASEPGYQQSEENHPEADIIFTTAKEKSQITFVRLSRVMERWKEELLKSELAARGLPASVSQPLDVGTDDVAEQTAYRGAALWSKILPVMLLIWALTGAFYPAVDLCAGEKERGTLETLLSAPAKRSEIVLGKLLTIMLFSSTTAVLNLLSVGVTGWLVLTRTLGFASPPPLAALWLVIALVPVSALFSALCLALAAFARSSKEGQYYLMPLLLITFPLAILPMVPGVELNLGNSLIPVTGVVLLLRSLLEGNFWEALQFLPVVVAVTLLACLLAVRWAVDQFNSESVLFRESERLNLGLWLRHLSRDRQPTPNVAAAVFCGVVILVIHFLLSATMSPSGDLRGFAKAVIVAQLVAVATPALLMTIFLTSSPRKTLLLKAPPLLSFPATLLLVVAVHPLVHALKIAVMRLYPLSKEMKEGLAGLFPENVNFWHLVLLAAVLPAVCEELAFRGFILSGLRHLGHRWRAIIYTAVLFGLVHGIVQQQLVACLVGVLIGYVAVQTGSILPCMLFHMLHNTLTFATSQIKPELLTQWPVLARIVTPSGEFGCVFHWPMVVVSGVATLLLLAFFARLPSRRSAEEELQEAIDMGLRSAGR
ncbi:MAG: ABC transporter permease subunit/CPBP intramembrane protease [Planctomycetota bacterium]|jgi:sodium transport system permease protein